VIRRGLYALAFVFAALGMGLTVAHVLEIPGKRQLTGAEWLTVQHTFYGGYAVAGGISEVGGIVASLGILAIDRRQGTKSVWPVISALAFAGMLAAYWFRNRPLNAEIAAWTPQTLPADWSAVRDRWDTAHSISAIFAAIAFGSLLAGVLTTSQVSDEVSHELREGRRLPLHA
jgi:hypothetical protein